MSFDYDRLRRWFPEGASDAYISRSVGVSGSMLSRLRSGHKKPGLKVLIGMIRYGIPFDEALAILGVEEEKVADKQL